MTTPPGYERPTTVTGRARARWLIPGGLLAAILVVMFILTMPIHPGFAAAGIVSTLLWATALFVTSFASREPRAHSRTQAAIMLSMALVGVLLLYGVFLSARG